MCVHKRTTLAARDTKQSWICTWCMALRSVLSPSKTGMASCAGLLSSRAPPTRKLWAVRHADLLLSECHRCDISAMSSDADSCEHWWVVLPTNMWMQCATTPVIAAVMMMYTFKLWIGVRTTACWMCHPFTLGLPLAVRSSRIVSAFSTPVWLRLCTVLQEPLWII